MGVTTASLAISTFLCNYYSLSVAYIEFNPTKEIHLLNPDSDKKRFSYKGIEIFSSITLSTIDEILIQDYAFFVLDFGLLNTYTVTEFKRCSLKLCICSLLPWKSQQLSGTLLLLEQEYKNYQREVMFLESTENNKENPKCVSSRCGIKVSPLPILSNPFQITSNEFMFFKSLLERKNISR